VRNQAELRARNSRDTAHKFAGTALIWLVNIRGKLFKFWRQCETDAKTAIGECVPRTSGL